jgi:hypothetical protein
MYNVGHFYTYGTNIAITITHALLVCPQQMKHQQQQQQQQPP